MSFTIPIVFEDSPFYRDSNFNGRRQPRHEREVRHGGRRPVMDQYFGQWPNFGSIFEDEDELNPYERRFYGQRAQRERQQRPSSHERTHINIRRQESDDEDVEGSDEMTGVTANMRDMRGLDGWDVPIQYSGTTPEMRDETSAKYGRQEPSRRHQPQEPPSSSKKYHERRGDGGKRQGDHRRGDGHRQKPAHRYATRSQDGNTENEKETQDVANCDDHPPTGDLESTEQTKNTIPADTSDTEETETEIPVEYSRKEPKKRLSRRLSQCDPPPLADIKIARIKSILEKIGNAEEQINNFEDAVQNKTFLFISETLMRALLDLDSVDSDGLDEVRKARKEAIVTVQSLVDKLEKKLEENKQRNTAKS